MQFKEGKTTSVNHRHMCYASKVAFNHLDAAVKVLGHHGGQKVSHSALVHAKLTAILEGARIAKAATAGDVALNIHRANVVLSHEQLTTTRPMRIKLKRRPDESNSEEGSSDWMVVGW